MNTPEQIKALRAFARELQGLAARMRAATWKGAAADVPNRHDLLGYGLRETARVIQNIGRTMEWYAGNAEGPTEGDGER